MNSSLKKDDTIRRIANLCDMSFSSSNGTLDHISDDNTATMSANSSLTLNDTGLNDCRSFNSNYYELENREFENSTFSPENLESFNGDDIYLWHFKGDMTKIQKSLSCSNTDKLEINKDDICSVSTKSSNEFSFLSLPRTATNNKISNLNKFRDSSCQTDRSQTNSGSQTIKIRLNSIGCQTIKQNQRNIGCQTEAINICQSSKVDNRYFWGTFISHFIRFLKNWIFALFLFLFFFYIIERTLNFLLN